METVHVKSRHHNVYSTIWLLLLPPIANMLFMHYYLYFSGLLEGCFMYSIVANIMSMVFDVFILLSLFTLLCRGKLKCAFALTHVITLVWAFINVLYARFFYQYLPLSAVSCL